MIRFDFESIMLPLLETLKDGREHSMGSLQDHLAVYFELTDEELAMEVEGENLFTSNIDQAKDHLLKADLIHLKNERIMITPLGLQVLHRRLNKLNISFLKRLPGYS